MIPKWAEDQFSVFPARDHVQLIERLERIERKLDAIEPKLKSIQAHLDQLVSDTERIIELVWTPERGLKS